MARGEDMERRDWGLFSDCFKGLIAKCCCEHKLKLNDEKQATVIHLQEIVSLPVAGTPEYRRRTTRIILL
jgi:hypothetical protein